MLATPRMARGGGPAGGTELTDGLPEAPSCIAVARENGTGGNASDAAPDPCGAPFRLPARADARARPTAPRSWQRRTGSPGADDLRGQTGVSGRETELRGSVAATN